MQKLTGTLYSNRLYFAGLAIMLLLVFLFTGLNSNDVVLPGNAHSFYLNVFFINYTFIGDGFFAYCLTALLIFYFKKKETGYTLLISFIISSLAIQLSRNFMNPGGIQLYFEAGTYLNFTGGLGVSDDSGLPSGHTAMAFALTTVLVLMIPNKKWQLPLLLAGILVGYSRIYLAQHFLTDVILGALLGTIAAIIAFYLVQSRFSLKGSLNKISQMPASPVSSAQSIQTV